MHPPLKAHGVRKHGKRGRHVSGSCKACVSIAPLGLRRHKPDFRTLAEEYMAATRCNVARYAQEVMNGESRQPTLRVPQRANIPLTYDRPVDP